MKTKEGVLPATKTLDAVFSGILYPFCLYFIYFEMR